MPGGALRYLAHAESAENGDCSYAGYVSFIITCVARRGIPVHERREVSETARSDLR